MSEMVDLQIIHDWLRCWSALDMDDIVADGGVTVAMVVAQEAHEMAARLRRVLDEVAALGAAIRPALLDNIREEIREEVAYAVDLSLTTARG